MLHPSQDAPCHPRVAFWSSEQGGDAFFRLVATYVAPPPRRDDPELARALRSALPHGLFVTDDVDARVDTAARLVAERQAIARVRAERYHTWVTTPQAPRLTQRGISDRGGGRSANDLNEHGRQLASNPFYAEWLASSGLVPPGGDGPSSS
jgi:hypothetical protein